MAFRNFFVYLQAIIVENLMKRWVLATVISLLLAPLYGQSAYDEIQKNVLLSASNYMAYPGPTQQKLTPAPRGYKPFYLSHYGRHGSRFHSKPSFYNAPYQTLLKADSLGKLTATGKDVLHRLDVIRKDAENHWGDLTWKGAHQLEGIARRMYERFPEIFQGKTNIDARSTCRNTVHFMIYMFCYNIVTLNMYFGLLLFGQNLFVNVR